MSLTASSRTDGSSLPPFPAHATRRPGIRRQACAAAVTLRYVNLIHHARPPAVSSPPRTPSSILSRPRRDPAPHVPRPGYPAVSGRHSASTRVLCDVSCLPDRTDAHRVCRSFNLARARRRATAMTVRPRAVREHRACAASTSCALCLRLRLHLRPSGIHHLPRSQHPRGADGLFRMACS